MVQPNWWVGMRLNLAVVAALAVASAYSPAANASDYDGMIIVLDVSPAVVEHGRPVEATITVRNIGKETVVLPSVLYPGIGLDVRVRDSHGSTLPRKFPRPKVPFDPLGVELAPDHFWGRTVDLAQWFQFEAGETYTVEASYVSKVTPAGATKEWLSPKVELIIVPTR